MAASRRGHPPLSLRLPGPGSPALLPDLPPISALFLIDFDVKAGYTIVWKQALPGLELDGVVEYKSLPSGLHTVAEDLIYFVHDAGHAGLSAFVNSRTDDAETRHARMIAVGVLVPLSYGRLGRAWRHAEALKDLAAKLVTDMTQTHLLQQYWEKNKARDTTAAQPLRETPLSSPTVSFQSSRPSAGKGHTRNRSASDGAALIPPGHRLSPFHPAWSLTVLLDTFGPLIFPIHRAALLRKRILISTHAPVHEACNFVYDISVLSNIPLSVLDLLDPSAPVQRLQPLFTIGVHDIPSLVERDAASKRPNGHQDDEATIDDTDCGWIACTTDSILAMKETLWDMLITLPPDYSANAKDRVWPSVESPKGVPVKATQRDLRRFRSLKAGLARLSTTASGLDGSSSPHSEPSPSTPGPRLSSSSAAALLLAPEDEERSRLAHETEPIVEPATWAALAYAGFMWWASAGEQRRTEEGQESAQDAVLLADLAAPSMSQPSISQQSSQPQQRPLSLVSASGGLADSVSSLTARRADAGEEGAEAGEDERARTELAIIAYFHRLTTRILSVLADIVESSDEDDLIGVVDVSPAVDDGDSSDADGEALLRPENGGGVRVGSDALNSMGLDVWSKADADFVREVTEAYFARRAYVEGKGVEVCGLRVC